MSKWFPVDMDGINICGVSNKKSGTITLSDVPFNKVAEIITSHNEEVSDLQKLLQEFVDISFFDQTDPDRQKIVQLKQKAKQLLGGQ